jgi:hypothetical protein
MMNPNFTTNFQTKHSKQYVYSHIEETTYHHLIWEENLERQFWQFWKPKKVPAIHEEKSKRRFVAVFSASNASEAVDLVKSFRHIYRNWKNSEFPQVEELPAHTSPIATLESGRTNLYVANEDSYINPQNDTL